MEKTTAELVKDEIDSSAFVKETLRVGLINYSALARRLLIKIKKLNAKANFSSVLIAIQRYRDEIAKENSEFEISLKKSLPSCEILIKDKVMTLTFHRTKKVMDIINQASKEIKWDMGDILFYVQGNSEVLVIIDKRNAEKFSKINNDLIEKKQDLVAISLREPEGLIYSKEVFGFLAFLTQALADKGINLYEIATTYKQIIFVVHEKDLTKTYETLHSLIEHCKSK